MINFLCLMKEANPFLEENMKNTESNKQIT